MSTIYNQDNSELLVMSYNYSEGQTSLFDWFNLRYRMY